MLTGIGFSYGTVGIPDGSVSVPSIRFAQDQDTGFYKPAASQLAAAVDGVQIILITASAVTLSVPFGALTITASSANALAVGRQGTTNPAFNIDTSTALSATGLNIAAAAAASGLALTVLSSGVNESMTLDAKGSGTINLAATSTGAVVIGASGTQTGAQLVVVQTGAGAFDVINDSGSGIRLGLPSSVATVPVLRLDCTATVNGTGIVISRAAAGAGAYLAANSTNASESLYLDGRGTFGVIIGSQNSPYSSHTIDGGLGQYASITVASAAGATWDGLYLAGSLTLSGNTNITNATGVNRTTFEAPTISAALALTITNSATVTIIGPPTGVGAGPAAITNAYSLWVQAGTSRFAGLIQGTLGLTITGAAVSLNASSNFDVNIATGTTTGAVSIGNSAVGIVTVANKANTAATMLITDGTANYYALDTRTGVTAVLAHTFDAANPTFASAAGSAFSLVNFAAVTLTLTGGTGVTALDGLGLLLSAPTVTSASATTITDASTLFITAPIAAGVGPAAFTNSWAIQTAGHIGPDADNTYTLGNAARRWSNMFTAIATVGDIAFTNGWRMTEGDKIGLDPDQLYLVSATGKRYRFVLEEVQ